MHKRGNNIAAVFVCGVGRSGTSLVQSILGTHSKIVFLPETAFIRRFIANGRFTRILTRKGVPGLNWCLKEDHMLQRLDPNFLQQIESYLQMICQVNCSNGLKFYNSIIEHYAAMTGKTYVGDKDPRMVEYLPLLKLFWPEARVVHVIRDPRDVLASKKKAAWSKDRHWLTHIFANRVQFRLGRMQGTEFFGNRYCEVIYEDLLADPEKVVGNLCKLLGVEYEPAMLHFEQTARNLVAEDEIDWKKETLGPILKSNPGKWKGQLVPLELAVTEQACEAAFTAGGYKRSDLKLSVGQQILVFCFSAVIIIADPVYRAYRRWFIWRKQR